MKPQEMRIAIAEHLGWKNIYVRSGKDISRADKVHGVLAGKSGRVPDFPRDLNAMRVAEKVLTAEQCEDYDQTLLHMEPDTFDCEAGGWTFFRSACQRAEAFLRTIGKWK